MRAGGHYSDFILATVCNTGTTNHKLQETGNHKLKETTKPQTLQAKLQIADQARRRSSRDGCSRYKMSTEV